MTRQRSESRPRLSISTAVLALALGGLGCTRPLQDLTPPAASKQNAPTFAETFPQGRIAGRVTWNGAAPDVPPIKGLISMSDGLRWGEMPNHMVPAIDPNTKGLADAVVFLKACDPKSAKPWPFEPLRIEIRDRKIGVAQGARGGRVGFARICEPIEMVSRDDDRHMLRARGAGFFTLPLPDPNKPKSRAIDAPGATEFTSAAGYFWSSAEVFTCEHPYYTTTDNEGRFSLENVPPGQYALIARHRNWKLLNSERDPETGKIMRLNFDVPFQTELAITVLQSGTPDVTLTLPK